MSSSGRPTARLAVSRCSWTALVVAVATALVTVVGPALAHSDLASSDPADGSTVTRPPRTVVLTFNEDVRDTGSAVVVTDQDGRRIDDPAALEVDGPRVTATVDAEAPSGTYTVAYRVVSADGHVITGTVGYRLDRPAPTATTPSAPTDSPPADPEASTGEPPAPEVSPAAGTSDSPAGLTWLAVSVAVAVAVLALLVARRSRG